MTTFYFPGGDFSASPKVCRPLRSPEKAEVKSIVNIPVGNLGHPEIVEVLPVYSGKKKVKFSLSLPPRLRPPAGVQWKPQSACWIPTANGAKHSEVALKLGGM